MKKLFAAVLALALFSPVARAANSPDVQKVLAQLDAASTKFKSTQADFQWDQLQKIVNETDTQTGTIYFLRQGAATQMAAQVKQNNGKDDPKTIVYKGGSLQLYQPKIKQITAFAAGKNKGQYESFLTLGFGGSGKDLDANWNITLVGNETIAGVQTVHLDLISKTESVRNMFSKVSIWVDTARGVSMKQVFLEPSGDRRTATYNNIRYNAAISDDAFTIHKAPGTTVVNR